MEALIFVVAVVVGTVVVMLVLFKIAVAAERHTKQREHERREAERRERQDRLEWEKYEALLGERRRSLDGKPYDWREKRYGELHRAERQKYATFIRDHGFICMEAACIFPTRVMKKGEPWHLAHDHIRGGDDDYLGPAHPECNQMEALERGIRWNGAPTQAELRERVRRLSVPARRMPADPWAGMGDPF